MLAAELLVAADDAGQIRLHQLATEIPTRAFKCVSMPLFVYLPCFPSVYSITHDTHERTTQGLLLLLLLLTATATATPNCYCYCYCYCY